MASSLPSCGSVVYISDRAYVLAYLYTGYKVAKEVGEAEELLQCLEGCSFEGEGVDKDVCFSPSLFTGHPLLDIGRMRDSKRSYKALHSTRSCQKALGNSLLHSKRNYVG